MRDCASRPPVTSGRFRQRTSSSARGAPCSLPGELLTDILLPSPPAHRGTAFERFALRRGLALAVASVAARLDFDGAVISGAAMALGAVSPTPMVAPEAAAILRGRRASAALFARAADACAHAAAPISDVRGSEAFRRDIVRVLARRALERAAARAGVEVAAR